MKKGPLQTLLDERMAELALDSPKPKQKQPAGIGVRFLASLRRYLNRSERLLFGMAQNIRRER